MVDDAVRSGSGCHPPAVPDRATNGCSSAGRGPVNRRSQASDPMDVTIDRCLAGSGKPTAEPTPTARPVPRAPSPRHHCRWCRAASAAPALAAGGVLSPLALAAAVDGGQGERPNDAVAAQVHLERVLGKRLRAGHREVRGGVKGLRVGPQSDEALFGLGEPPGLAATPPKASAAPTILSSSMRKPAATETSAKA